MTEHQSETLLDGLGASADIAGDPVQDEEHEKPSAGEEENRKDTLAETMAAEPKRFCRKCLIRDFSMDEYFKNLYEYIENIDADLKVEDAIYESRLAICKECDNLVQGMCRICGCYVELRAVMKKNACPMGSPRWGRVREEEE